MKNPSRTSLFSLCCCITLLFSGCSPGGSGDLQSNNQHTHHDHDHGDGHHHHHDNHHDIGPNGGTVAHVGNDEFHLEFVVLTETSEVVMYVLDDALERFVRIQMPSIQMVLKDADNVNALKFLPAPAETLGETAGDTSVYKAKADGVDLNLNLYGTLEEIEIGEKIYKDVQVHVHKSEGP